MKKTLLLVLLVFPAGVLAAEGMRMTFNIETSQAGKPMTMKTTYYFQGDRMRIESQADAIPQGSSIILKTGPDAPSVLLMPEAKTYMELPNPDPETVKSAGKKYGSVAFQATGKKKNIAGHSCEVVERTVDQRKEQACINKELTAMFRKIQSTASTSSQEYESVWPKGVNGFPLEFVVTQKGSKETDMRMVLSELHKGKLEESLFKIPSGYQAQGFPKMDPKMMQMLEELKKKQK